MRVIGRFAKYFSVDKLFDDPEKAQHVKDVKADLIERLGVIPYIVGIVIFDKDIPQELLLKDQQIKLNKDDVDTNGFIKIDILSNRGIAQLFDISEQPLDTYPKHDMKTMQVLIYGDNIGLTFAESPGMRKLFLKYRPRTI